MLEMFRFKNYGPFKEEAVLDMRAVKSYKEHPYNVITTYEDVPLLKVAAIYGANASGKSNFVDAYYLFGEMVRNSFQKNNKDSDDSFLESSYNSFMFDSETVLGDTEFEAVFLKDGYELKYGFIYNHERIKFEWLYRTSVTSKRTSVILERDEEHIELGYSVKRSCEKYLPEIDSDVLALSFFSSLKLKNTVFSRTLLCITEILPVSLSRDNMADFMLRRYFEKSFDDEEKTKLLAFLRGIDVGIQDIHVEKNNNSKRVDVYTFHKGSDGTLWSMPFKLESDGTHRAIAIYSVLRMAAHFGGALIVDEFHSQLHPLLQKYLVDLFCEESKEGQLIYTTHDTSLLDKKYMRRDQVWFVDKDEDGVSSLYSLADFKVRNDASFEKDYLGGIYGGIPNLKDFSFGEE